ncbi:transposase [Candidatus Parcubacteria bacterium]|nr:transposase [Candidatus Parcubacteria bacterium]
MRSTQFQTNEYYHIYNRGTDKRTIFCDEKDYIRFLWNIRNFNNNSKHEERIYLRNKRGNNLELSSEASELSSKLLALPKFVEIIAYCLIPNHYHFLLKQSQNKGVEKFMHKVGTSYTNYFNKKYNRSGSLFQGTYKSIHIKTSGNLWRLSCCINGNAEIHGIGKAKEWSYLSYQDYLGLRNGTLINKNTILDEFKDINEYKNLIDYVIKDSRGIKNIVLE